MTGVLDRPRPTLADLIESLDPDGSIRAKLEQGDASASSPVVAGAECDPDDLPPLVRRVERARKYLARVPAAIQGQGGSNPTFAAARALVHGLCLDVDTALGLMLAEYNHRCEPPWSVKELEHKVRHAAEKPCKKPRGWLLTSIKPSRSRPAPALPPAGSPPPADPPPGSASTNGDGEPEIELNEADDDPHRLARSVLAGFMDGERRTLAYWRGEFHVWNGCSYQTRPDRVFRPRVNVIVRDDLEKLHRTAMLERVDGPLPKMAKVTDSLVGNVLAALQGMALVAEVEDAPAWINNAAGPDPRELVPAQNGLVHLPAYARGVAEAIRKNTPDYLNFNAVGFEADRAAPKPVHWLSFLEQLWPDDPDSISLLQEWFGYLLSPETRAQKMLLMVGPPRSGKGTINRVLQALVGEENCATPALGGDDGLGGRFGLQSLLQKSVAVVEDARIPRGPATTTAVARMLTISGEGCITVDRKNAPALPRVRLYTRFVIATNEMPDLPDASTALARRWCILRMTKSFLGQEDTGLADRLTAELPGIFNWAVEGWKRLQERKWRFTMPESSRREVEELIDLSSPVSEFLRERCDIGSDRRTPCKEVYAAWRQWCDESGRREPGTDKQFGRLLSAANATIFRFQARIGGERSWCYPLRLREPYEEDGDLLPWERSRVTVSDSVSPFVTMGNDANGDTSKSPSSADLHEVSPLVTINGPLLLKGKEEESCRVDSNSGGCDSLSNGDNGDTFADPHNYHSIASKSSTVTPTVTNGDTNGDGRSLPIEEGEL